MNGKELLEGMGYIDESFIKEAEVAHYPVSRNRTRWMALAACLCIGLFGITAAERIQHLQFPEENITYEAEKNNLAGGGVELAVVESITEADLAPARSNENKLQEQSFVAVAEASKEMDVSGYPTAVTDFAVRLFQSSMKEGENTLISPLSVFYALAMTANGAEGETLSQMEAVLGLPKETMNEWLQNYMEQLSKEKTCQLTLANGIWFKEDPEFEIKEEFARISEEYFASEVVEAPFDETTLLEINAWVEEQTDGMIKDILDEIPEEAVMYLVNALAFEAEWENIYKEYEVQEGIFTGEKGEEQTVEMMNSKERMYLEDENAVGFLKYYKDQTYAFAALLPDEGINLAEYVTGLTGEHLSELLTNAEEMTVYAGIPKFEAEYDVEMSEVLEKMGMTDAFNRNRADFSRMAVYQEPYFYISRVLHKTFLSVAEQGTRAGASTVVEMVNESAMIEEFKEVELNRPFVYMLIDCENKIPFFIGTVVNMEVD